MDGPHPQSGMIQPVWVLDLVGPAVAAFTNTACHPEHQTGQGLQEEPGERLALKMLCLITFQFTFDEHLRSQLLPARLFLFFFCYYYIFFYFYSTVFCSSRHTGLIYTAVFRAQAAITGAVVTQTQRILIRAANGAAALRFDFFGFQRGRMAESIHKTRCTRSQNCIRFDWQTAGFSPDASLHGEYLHFCAS